MEFKTLSNGVVMPSVGYGLWKTPNGEDTVRVVKQALAAGYRHIDTAKIYGNEEGVGQAIKESGIPREELFVTTKLWNDAIRAGTTKEALAESLERLQLDYVDLYLMHWPIEGKNEAWLAMEELYKEGKTRAIGVSNYHKERFEELMEVATITPMVNQIEINPALTQKHLIPWYQEQGVLVQAWSPLGGIKTSASLLTDPKLVQIAEKYNKSAAQVALRWNLQHDVVILPKSTNEARMKQNLDVFDFSLTKEELEIIDSMNTNTHSGPNPDTFKD